MNLPHPYKGLNQNDSKETYRLNVVISRKDYDLIMMVSPIHGTLQFITGTMIYNLCTYLREHGITTYSPRELQRAVLRCANCRTVAEKPCVDDARRTALISNSVAESPIARDVQIQTGLQGEAQDSQHPKLPK